MEFAKKKKRNAVACSLEHLSLFGFQMRFLLEECMCPLQKHRIKKNL